MSAVHTLLENEVEVLTHRNQYLEAQNERLAHLLAEALGILDKFAIAAKDKLRHYTRNSKGKYDPEELLDR